MFDLENLEKHIRDERQLKALIWLWTEEFRLLEELYCELDKHENEEAYKKRKELNPKARRSSGWNPSKLNSYKKKVFFSLYYLKTYPTYDVMWFAFWMHRSTVCVNLHIILPILKLLFKELWIAPKREINTIEDLKEAFNWNIVDLIADWTERRYFRSKDYEKQKEDYSWKKKDHTKKNLIISDERQFIWYLWPTVNWKQHDYSILKNEFLGKNVFIETTLMLDLWFYGVVSNFWDTIKWILIPEKKQERQKITLILI